MEIQRCTARGGQVCYVSLSPSLRFQQRVILLVSHQVATGSCGAFAARGIPTATADLLCSAIFPAGSARHVKVGDAWSVHKCRSCRKMWDGERRSDTSDSGKRRAVPKKRGASNQDMSANERADQPTCMQVAENAAKRQNSEEIEARKKTSRLPVGCPMQMSWIRKSADMDCGGCQVVCSPKVSHRWNRIKKPSVERKKSCLEIPRAWRRFTSCTQKVSNSLGTLMPQWQRSKAETKNTVRGFKPRKTGIEHHVGKKKI